MKSTAEKIANSGGLSAETLKKLGSVLRSHPAVEQIILFGYRAMNLLSILLTLIWSQRSLIEFLEHAATKVSY